MKRLFLFLLFAFVLIGGASAATLQAAYTFDNNCTYDATGNGNILDNNGGVTNVAYGVNGNSCYFNNTGGLDRNAAVTGAIGTTWSITGFINTNTSAQDYIVDFNTGGSRTILGIEATTSFFQNFDGSWRSTTEDVSTGSWKHVAVVRTGAAYTLFVDGVNVTSGTGNAVNLLGQYGVGQAQTGGTSFDGYMDNLCIFEGALSAAEVSNNYNGGLGNNCNTTEVSSQFLITAIDAYSSSAINSFNATVNGYTHTTTNGNIAFNTTSDWSGNNNWATVNGATYNSTYESYEFDGVNDYLAVADSTHFVIPADNFNLTASFTTTAANSNQKIFEKYTGSGSYITAYMHSTYGLYTAISISGEGTVGLYWTGNADTLRDGNKHEFSFVSNGTGYYLYIDGSLRRTYAAVLLTGDMNNTADLQIGRRGVIGGSGYWNGSIHKVSITSNGDTVLYLPFSRLDAAPDTTLIDRASYSRLATNNGATYNATESAYDFDGVNDNLFLGTTSDNGLNFSSASNINISATVTPAIANSGNKAIVGNLRWSSAANNVGGIYLSNNKFAFRISNGTTGCAVTSNSDYVAGTSYNISGYWSGTTCYLYINGVQQTSTGTVTGSINNLARNIYVGADWTGAANLFNGSIDNVEIALSGVITYSLPFTQDANTTINVTSSADNYFSRNYTNRETTSNLQTSLIANILGATVTEKVSGAAVSSYTINTSGNGGSASNSTGNTLYLTTGNYTIDWRKSGYYPTSNSYEALGATSGATSFTVHNHILNISINDLSGQGNTSNFTVNIYSDDYAYSETISTTNASAIAYLIHGNYTLYINDSNWALTNSTIQLNNTENFTNTVINIYTTNSFNLTFYNETSNAALNNITIYYQVIGSLDTLNGSTNNGSVYVDLLTPDDYKIVYWYDTERPREYYVTLTNGSFNLLRLYLIDQEISTTYIPLVTDETDRACSENTISLLRYYIDINGYRTVSMVKTDTNGYGLFYVEPNTVNYKLYFEGSCGTFTSAPQKIIDSTNSFTVTEGQTYLASSIAIAGASVALEYINATKTYTFDWSDSTNTVTQGCLYVYKTQRGVQTTNYSACSSASSGSLIYTLTGNLTNTLWDAQGVLSTNTEYSTYTFGVATVDFRQIISTLGADGLLLGIIAILAVVMLFGNTASSVVFSSVAAFAILASFGIIAGAGTITVSLVILAVVILYKMRTL